MSAKIKLSAAVFALALVLRLITLMFVLPKLRSNADPDSYRTLAQNLAAGKGLVSTAADGRELPNVWRTPGYPLFLAGLIRMFGDRLGLFLAVQCVLGALTCALTLVLASRWLRHGAALVAGLLVAIDPNSVLRCSDIRTETLFTLLIVGGACVIVWRSDKMWGWLATGLLWSLATMTRPIAVWIWVVALVIVVGQRVSWRDRGFYLAAFLIGFLPLEGLWVARNHAISGRYFISTIPTHNLMFRALGVEAERQGRKLEDLQHEFYAQHGDLQFFDDPVRFEQSLRDYKQFASEHLFSAPLHLAKEAVVGCGKLLFGPGVRALDNAVTRPVPSSRWWPPLYSAALLVVALLSLLGVRRLGREAIVPALLLLYFVTLSSGSESNSRFRVPITPLLAVLAVAGACGPEKKI